MPPTTATAFAARYIAVPGSNYTDADARVIGPELSRIAAEVADPTNETLVALAADPASPLHPYLYRLDDAAAARQHRLDQASRLVGAILVEFDTPTGHQTMRAFEYITIAPGAGDDEEGYDDDPDAPPSVRPRIRRRRRRIVTAEYVLTHVDASDEVVANAHHMLQAFRDKYRGYQATIPAFQTPQFAAVLTAIDALFAERPPRRRRRRRARP